MKNLLLALIASVVLSISSFAVIGAETKKVCVDQIQKNGSKKEVCKEIKVHKKLEGTPVPGQKK